jgi:hypothetical protein
VLRTSFEKASSCIDKRLPAFLVVFEAILESTFWHGAELFCNDHVNGMHVDVSVVEIKKNSQSDKSGEYGAFDSTVI